MQLSEIEYTALCWAAHDYEAIHTIKDNVSMDLSRKVSEAELGKALVALHSKGLVNSYVYDGEEQRYVEAEPEDDELLSYWWLTSKKGNKVASGEL
jgi:hypothetical protein